ncbi:MAG TPA: hypothetical protein VNN79_05925 [Actinomycetota bacterium]|nr:hypothetical protein [Actinomycetota bacterium]
MTFAPQSLLDLQTYWVAQGGRSLGITGDASHLAKGTSYHLGKDDLIAGAYSAIRPRDKAGLTNAASAIDLGALDGTLANLRAFSDWLARRCVKHVAGTGDVVEVIYSPDGKRVLGFKDGVDFLIPNYGDASHLTHTHISFFRDSQQRDKTALFQPYFLPDSSTEDPMLPFTIRGDTPPGSVKATTGTAAVTFVLTAKVVGIPIGSEFRVYATVRRVDTGEDCYLVGVPDAGPPAVILPAFLPVADADIVVGPPPVVDCTDAVEEALKKASARAAAAVLTT